MSKGINAVKWSLIDNFALNIFSLVVFFLLAIKLPVSDFGLVNISTFFIFISSLLVNFGFNVAIIQKKEISKTELNTVFLTIISLSIFLSLLMFVFSDPISVLLKQPALALILKVMSPMLLFKGLSIIPESLLQRNMDFKKLALRNIITSVLSGSFAIALAYSNYGYLSLVLQQLSSSIIGVILLWSLAKWKPTFNFDFKSLKSLFSYARLLFVTEIVSYFNKEGIRLFISYYLGATALGFYSLANRLMTITIQLITVSLTKVTLPYFSKIQNDLPTVRANFLKITSLAGIIAYPVIFGLLVFSTDILVVFLGSKWESSMPIFQILICTAFITTLSYFNGTLITALGKAKWRMKLSFVRAFIGSVLFYIGANISLEFVAIMFVLRAILVEPIQFYLVFKLTEIPWKDYLKNIVSPFILGTTLASIVFVLKKIINISQYEVSIQFLILIVLLCGMMTGYCLLIWRFENDKFVIFKSYLKHFKNKKIS